jgi:hypothetical protein
LKILSVFSCHARPPSCDSFIDPSFGGGFLDETTLLASIHRIMRSEFF